MKRSEHIKVNDTIIPSANDIKKYINHSFTSIKNEVGKVIGIHSIRSNSKKMYVVEFKDGRRTITDSYGLVSGKFYPRPYSYNYRVVGSRPVNQSQPNKNFEPELSMSYVRQLERQVQNLQDKNRILRKVKRSDYRNDVLLDEFIDNVVNEIKTLKPINPIPSKPRLTTASKLIVQLSDLHFGKIVNLDQNKYNFEVAESRLKQYLREIDTTCKQNEVDDITVCFTGDLFNLDSHLDTLLSNENNRAVNFTKGLDLLIYFIEHLYKKYSVQMVGIVGNESRIRAYEEQSNLDKISSNNFDYLAFQILSRMFPDIRKINECNKLKSVFEVYGHTIGIFHGDKINKHTREELVKQSISLYEEYQIYIDFMIFGHIHEHMITPTYARSGSLVGMDEYAKNKLNIINSVPSQNVYLVNKDRIRPIPIQLD